MVVKTAFCVSRGTFGIFLEEIFVCILFLRNLSGKISDFDRKFFGNVVKTAFYLFRETFWGFKRSVTRFTTNWENPVKKVYILGK